MEIFKVAHYLLRLQKQISGPDRGLLVGPFGTGEFAVLTASSGDCRNGVCTFIDTQAQLKTYVIAAQSWAPEVKFWPAPYVISGGASVQVDNYRGARWSRIRPSQQSLRIPAVRQLLTIRRPSLPVYSQVC